jgi:hypothetical protein
LNVARSQIDDEQLVYVNPPVAAATATRSFDEALPGVNLPALGGVLSGRFQRKAGIRGALRFDLAGAPGRIAGVGFAAARGR